MTVTSTEIYVGPRHHKDEVQLEEGEQYVRY